MKIEEILRHLSLVDVGQPNSPEARGSTLPVAKRTGALLGPERYPDLADNVSFVQNGGRLRRDLQQRESPGS